MLTEADLLARFHGVKRNGQGWTALCPSHDDHSASLSIRCYEDGFGLRCFTGCHNDDILRAVGLTKADLKQAPEPPARGESLLASFASDKGLPVAFLRQLGFDDTRYNDAAAIKIPYLGIDGKLVSTRYRLALTGADRFRWKKGSTTCLFGLQRLADAKKQGTIVIVEGESDAVTLWFNNIAAIGIPGATNWREDRDAALLDGFTTILVVIERDAGGEAVKKWLAQSSIRDRVKLVTMPDGLKDPSALFIDSPDRFPKRWADLCRAAVPWQDDGEVRRPYRGLMTSAEFLASMVPPAYLIDGLLLKGSTYLLTGNTGHCKTLLALLMAIRVATGGGFFGKDCKQGTVVFMAGENADNVKIQLYALCAELDIDGPSLPILWHEGVFSIEDAKDRLKADLVAHPDLALVIYDSLQAFFEGDDDNDNVEALDTIVNVRALTAGHQNRPVNLILAHPVKKASKDNLLPRGGSSVVNESDGNFTAWLMERMGEFHWQGKLRGIPFDPLKFETILVKPQGLVDEEGEQMPCIIVKPMGPRREAELKTEVETRRIEIMKAIDGNPMVFQITLAQQLNVSRTTIQNDFKALEKDKLIEPLGKAWRLTAKGKEVLEMEAEYG